MGGENDIGLNVVIRDLPQHLNEDLKLKADYFFQDGLKVKVTCEKRFQKRKANQGL